MNMQAERDAHGVDKRQARLAFQRAASRYDEAAVLQREVGGRLAERLDYVRLKPRHILDLGCGTGFMGESLRRRYGRAWLLSLDFAPAMLREARRRLGVGRRLLRRDGFLCADAEHLPLRPRSFDLIVSNLTLQWCNDPDLAFAGLRRALRPGGLLMFTTFGPDTLKELRLSWQAADGHTHVNAFLDMHDIGDALLRAGFADPVLDVEHFTLTYENVRGLMDDLKILGAHNATSGRPRGLTGRARLRRMTTAYEAHRRNGLLPATYEVIYGHCWAPRQETEGGTEGGAVSIPLEALRGRRRQP